MAPYKEDDIWLEESLHHTYNHPTIPKDTGTYVEVSLKGGDLKWGFMSQSFEPQQPDTARLFLCCTRHEAEKAFAHLGMREASMYLRAVQGCQEAQDSAVSSTRTMSEAFQRGSTFGQLLVPYDPRELFTWLELESGQSSTLMLAENMSYMTSSSKRRADLVVHNQIRITRRAHNMYAAVWFDFLDQTEKIADGTEEPQIDYTSKLQRDMMFRFLRGETLLNKPLHCATDFPGLLLLDILNSDMSNLSNVVLRDEGLTPIKTIRSHYIRSIEEHIGHRLETLEYARSLSDRAEGLLRLAKHLNSADARGCLSAETVPAFTKQARQLEISTAFIVEKLQKKLTRSEQDLSITRRAVQARQASSLSALTYSAALFLPFSFSASFFSMQTRLADLNLLIYDFFGVALGSVTVAYLTYFGFRTASKVKTWWRAEKQKGLLPWLGYIRVAVRWYTHLCMLCWSAIVVSFFVGAVHDLRTGLIIFGAAAGTVALPMPMALILYMIAVWLFSPQIGPLLEEWKAFPV